MVIFLFFHPQSSHFICFPISMKLGEKVTSPSLKVVSLCERVPMQSAVPTWFVGRAGSDVSMGHVFSQGVLAAPRVVGSRAEVGGDRESHIQILAGASHMLNDCYSPIRGGVGAQGAGARSLQFLLVVRTSSALVHDVARVWGLMAAQVCACLTFPQCAHLG